MMSSVRTYIFGNPAGWSLYEGDPDELNYFKSFYVSTRRGSRLMVNRRADGSVAYVYINYGLKENSGRCGDAHFGMAAVIDGGMFTPQFNMVFRFMEALFERVMEMPDSLFTQTDAGLRYRVHELSDGAETIGWIKDTLPKIFVKTGLQEISSDPTFKSGKAGQIATFPDTATDGEILDGLRSNDWIAISPSFRKTDGAGTVTPVELNLYDVVNLYGRQAKLLLDCATDKIRLSKADLVGIRSQINDTRISLSSYIKGNPGDADEARKIQNDFSGLLKNVDSLIEKSGSRITPPDFGGRTPATDGSKDKNPDKPDKPKPSPVGDDLIPLLKKHAKPVAIACSILIVVLVAVKFLRGKEQPDTSDNTELYTPADSVSSYDEAKFKKFLDEKNFTAALAEIERCKSNSDTYNDALQQLQWSVESCLLDLCLNGEPKDITKFFLENALVAKAIYPDSEAEKDWFDRADNCNKFKAYLDKPKLNYTEYREAMTILIAMDPHLNNYKQAISNRHEAWKADQNRNDTATTTGQNETGFATVTCGSSTKSGKAAIGFTVKGDFTITSSLPLRCLTTGTEVTFTNNRKTAKVSNPKKDIMFKSGGTTITITVKTRPTEIR